VTDRKERVFYCGERKGERALLSEGDIAKKTNVHRDKNKIDVQKERDPAQRENTTLLGLPQFLLKAGCQ
jgi:hypothetical protein